MRERFLILTTIGFFLLSPYTALAHGGGVDNNGCHTNYSTGAYHCHNDSSNKDISVLGVVGIVALSALVIGLMIKADSLSKSYAETEDTDLEDSSSFAFFLTSDGGLFTWRF